MESCRLRSYGLNQNSYIFLDIDGVLNTEDHLRRQISEKGRSTRMDWCPIACNNLSRLCKKFECKIVITSSWRHEFDLDELKQIFESNGISRELVLDVTPSVAVISDEDNDDYCMGNEIQQWLEEKSELDSPYLIICDKSDVLESQSLRLIQVDKEDGFANPDSMIMAVQILARA
jgi:hypothetical protein